MNNINKKTVVIISAVVVFVTCIVLVLFIPRQYQSEVKFVSWTWEIPVYKYTPHEEKSWYKPPKDAYDVYTKWEYRRTITKKDSNGNTKKERVYDNRYYYKINKWDYSYSVNSTGIDRNPHESSVGDLPYSVSDPQVGDVYRTQHKEKYECCVDYKGNNEVFEISKEDWNRLEKGCRIRYKRRLISKKIFDIEFGYSE